MTTSAMSSAPACDLNNLQEDVQNLELKPFATGSASFGDWTISAHSCGYFLSSKSGYQFNFKESDVDSMFDTLRNIIEGTYEFIVYSTGSGGIYHQGKMHRYDVGPVRHAYDYFQKALKRHCAVVMKLGTKSEMTKTDYAALVAANPQGELHE